MSKFNKNGGGSNQNQQSDSDWGSSFGANKEKHSHFENKSESQNENHAWANMSQGEDVTTDDDKSEEAQNKRDSFLGLLGIFYKGVAQKFLDQL